MECFSASAEFAGERRFLLTCSQYGSVKGSSWAEKPGFALIYRVSVWMLNRTVLHLLLPDAAALSLDPMIGLSCDRDRRLSFWPASMCCGLQSKSTRLTNKTILGSQ